MKKRDIKITPKERVTTKSYKKLEGCLACRQAGNGGRMEGCKNIQSSNLQPFHSLWYDNCTLLKINH